jgi:hypothetical protein
VSIDVLQHVNQGPAVIFVETAHKLVATGDKIVGETVRLLVLPGQRVVGLPARGAAGEESGPYGDFIGAAPQAFGLVGLMLQGTHLDLQSGRGTTRDVRQWAYYRPGSNDYY